MTPRRSLITLQRRARRRIGRLFALAAANSNLTKTERDRITAYIVIECTNLWAAYCRSLFLSSAYGASDADGPVLPASKRLATEEQAITEAIRFVKPNLLKNKKPPWSDFDEPTWRKSEHFGTAMSGLGASNAPRIAKALAANSTVLSELPKFRNFYAHRARSTAEEARMVALVYTLPPTGHPTDIVWRIPSGSSESLLLNWLRDLDGIVDLSV